MSEYHDRSAAVFGNEIDGRTYAKACRAKARNAHKYGADSEPPCHLSAVPAPVIGTRLGVRQLVPATSGKEAFDIAADSANSAGPPVVIGNIRMGFGHYRIAMAFASAAHSLGYTPYWLDLCGFPDTAATKLIQAQNRLYSLGSRLSQKSRLFDTLYWEPLNSQGFRQLTYNAQDQKNAELMCGPYRDLPREVAFVGTHAWCAQAALHAGLTHVVNAIPDNWPMALHLAEGSTHIVQTPSAYLGYKMLRGMDRKRVLSAMPAGSLVHVGHYVDHELVSNAAADCALRSARLQAEEPVRYLLTVGGAGAQTNLIQAIIEHLLPYVSAGKACLLLNVGDHRDVWNQLARRIPNLQSATQHFGSGANADTGKGATNDAGDGIHVSAAKMPTGTTGARADEFAALEQFALSALDNSLSGIHVFYDPDIFGAVYSTNLLMRICDVLVTKPSELAYYPVPKLMIRRVGGHEAWGAVRTAELGDGTYEMSTPAEACAMIDCLQHETELVEFMCANICAETERGTYNGAYEGIRLATGSAPAAQRASRDGRA